MVFIKIQRGDLEGLLLLPPAATIAGVYSFSASIVVWRVETEADVGAEGWEGRGGRVGQSVSR